MSTISKLRSVNYFEIEKHCVLYCVLYCVVLFGRGTKTITITIITPVPSARGVRKSQNPAQTTTHSGIGVKETHNFMLWEKVIYENKRIIQTKNSKKREIGGKHNYINYIYGGGHICRGEKSQKKTNNKTLK